jgi:hypothetical protein
MRKVVQAGLFVAAFALAHPGRAQAPAEPLPLPLDDAIARALEHNRDLVKGALDVQGSRLAADRARETARGLRIVPAGGAETGSDGDDWNAGLGAEATGSTARASPSPAAARQIAVDGAATTRREEVRTEIEQPLLRNFGPLSRTNPSWPPTKPCWPRGRAWERDRSALVVSVVELYEDLIYLRRQIEATKPSPPAWSASLPWPVPARRRARAARTEVLRMDCSARGRHAPRNRARAAGVRFQESADRLGLPLDTAFRRRRRVAEPRRDRRERALAVALAERPDYAQALQDVETADRQLRLARRTCCRPAPGRPPDHYGEGEEWSDAGRLDQDDWFVGYRRRRELESARRAPRRGPRRRGCRGRRQVAEIVRNRLAVEVNAALSAYRRTRAEVELAARNRELAANRAELARELFAAGRATADSASDAEADAWPPIERLAARRDASVAATACCTSWAPWPARAREILARKRIMRRKRLAGPARAAWARWVGRLRPAGRGGAAHRGGRARDDPHGDPVPRRIGSAARGDDRRRRARLRRAGGTRARRHPRGKGRLLARFDSSQDRAGSGPQENELVRARQELDSLEKPNCR